MRPVLLLLPALVVASLLAVPGALALGVTAEVDLGSAGASAAPAPLSATSVRAAPIADVTDFLEAVDWHEALSRPEPVEDDGADEATAAAASTDAPEEALRASTWTREDAARAAAVGPALWLAASAVGRVLGASAVGGLGLLPGYARITRADVLENAPRNRVYGLLRDRPGLSASEIQVLTGLGWGTVTYHLDRLSRTGLVTSERSGLSRRYFPTADVAPGDRKAMAALERPQLSALAKHVLTSPGLPQGELAALAGLTKSAAAKQLAALEDAGLVQREREGRVARVKPTDTLATLVA